MINTQYKPQSDYRWEPSPLTPRPRAMGAAGDGKDDSGGKTLIVLLIVAVVLALKWYDKQQQRSRQIALRRRGSLPG